MKRKKITKAGLYLARHREDGEVVVVVEYVDYQHGEYPPGFYAQRHTGRGGHCSYGGPGRRMSEEYKSWRLLKGFTLLNQSEP